MSELVVGDGGDQGPEEKERPISGASAGVEAGRHSVRSDSCEATGVRSAGRVNSGAPECIRRGQGAGPPATSPAAGIAT
jgi:hypothetical protein